MTGVRGRERGREEERDGRRKKEEGNWDGIGSSGKMKLWKWNINEKGREEGKGKKKRKGERDVSERFFFLMKFSSVNSPSLWFSFGRVLHLFFFFVSY